MGTVDMKDKLKLIIQCVLYFLIFLFGFMAAVPVGNTSDDFDGNCIMHFEVNSHDNLFSVSYGGKSKCNYVIAIHVLFSILYATAMMALHGFALFKTLFKQETLEIMDNFLVNIALLAVHCLATFLCFVAACVITDGFKKFCNELEDAYPKIDECSDFQTFLKWDDVDGSHFHKNYSLATTACWLATLIWIVATALVGLVTWRKLRNRRSGNTESATTTTSTTTTTTTASVSVVDKY